MTRRLLALSFLALTLPLVGCVQNNVNQNQQISNRIEQVVGPEGAVIENGGIRADIPPGALNEDVTIAVTEYGPMDQPKSAIPGYEFASNVYELEPHGQGFALDVNLQIDIESEAAGPFVVARATETGEFEPVPTELVDDQMAVLSTPVFSYYAVFAVGDGGGTGEESILECDPRAGMDPTCPPGSQCVGEQTGDQIYELQCQSSSGEAMVGEECTLSTDCADGLNCLSNEFLPSTCTFSSCCTAFCTTPDGMECEMDQICDRLDSNNMATPDDIGLCIE